MKGFCYLKKTNKGTGGWAEVIEHLPSKGKALNLNPN
jgi:hypothetical protein